MTHKKPGLLTKALDFITAPKVVIGVFALLVCFLVPSTLSPKLAQYFLQPAKYILIPLALSLIICTVRKFKTLKRSTLVIHTGVIAVLAGGLVSTLGYVATVNIYEGAFSDTVYNWDVEQDVPLGFNLKIVRINMDFYPVPVKVGVLKNGRKAELFVTSTDDSFTYEDFRVNVVSLDPMQKNVQLEVFDSKGAVVGTMVTGGQNNLPAAFPLDFKLVAFVDPVVKRMWVDLELWKDGELLRAGTSEVNHPLTWQGMQLFLTSVATDDLGRPYAGIQISRDPGLPFVYAGFAIFSLGLLMAMRRWVTVGKSK